MKNAMYSSRRTRINKWMEPLQTAADKLCTVGSGSIMVSKVCRSEMFVHGDSYRDVETNPCVIGTSIYLNPGITEDDHSRLGNSLTALCDDYPVLYGNFRLKVANDKDFGETEMLTMNPYTYHMAYEWRVHPITDLVKWLDEIDEAAIRALNWIVANANTIYGEG